MSELVERVAMRHYHGSRKKYLSRDGKHTFNRPDEYFWERAPAALKEFHRKRVKEIIRAVLADLAVPSSRMIDAAVDREDIWPDMTSGGDPYQVSDQVWQAMLGQWKKEHDL